MVINFQENTTKIAGLAMSVPFTSILDVHEHVADEELKTFVGQNLHRLAIMIGLCVRDFVNTPPATMATSEYAMEYRAFIHDFIHQSSNASMETSDPRLVQFSSVLGMECLDLMKDEIPPIFRGKLSPEKVFDRHTA